MKDYAPYLRLAKEALKQYNLDVQKVGFFTEETNIFFLVETNDEKYVLKISQEESSTYEDNLVEVLYLKNVEKNGIIKVPKIINNLKEEPITRLKTDDFDIEKRVIVYEFMEGKEFDGNETPQLFYQLGQKMAYLHQIGKEIILPKDLTAKRWNQVFYFRDEEVVYQLPKYQGVIDEKDVNLLDEIIPLFDGILETFYDAETYMIHGDLNPWNILLHHNELRFIDFEDGIIGNVIHDLAITLFYYKHDKNVNYKEVKSQIFKGYESIAPLPEITEFQLDFLMMARSVNFINYVLLIDDDPKEYIKERMVTLRDFLEKYSIN